MKITTVPPGAPPSRNLLLRTNSFNSGSMSIRSWCRCGSPTNRDIWSAAYCPSDFSVYEDGKKQKLNFFTSDPFALSVAVVIDLGMPDIAVQKVNETFSTLSGAFAGFDEIAIYTYSTSVSQLADFSAVGRKLEGVLNGLKTKHGEVSGSAGHQRTTGASGPVGQRRSH